MKEDDWKVSLIAGLVSTVIIVGLYLVYTWATLR